jgi:hypothetical protein
MMELTQFPQAAADGLPVWTASCGCKSYVFSPTSKSTGTQGTISRMSWIWEWWQWHKEIEMPLICHWGLSHWVCIGNKLLIPNIDKQIPKSNVNLGDKRRSLVTTCDRPRSTKCLRRITGGVLCHFCMSLTSSCSKLIYKTSLWSALI